MHFSSFLFACTTYGLVTSASPLQSSRLYGGDASPRALYFLENNPEGNSIVAVEIHEKTGKLSHAVKTPTEGKGLAALAAISQDSVVVSGNYLFTINAGSDTLSVFEIDPQQPRHLRLIGEPAATLGHTPVSVTYSEELKTACVVNGGKIAGVACFDVDPYKGLTLKGPMFHIPQTERFDPTRPLPPGPLVLTADIRFNPSSTALFTTIRSNGGRDSLLYAWPVEADGTISNKLTNNTLPDIGLAFSLNFLDSDSKLFLTNPHLDSPGAAILDLDSVGKIDKINTVTIPGQLASCWGAYDLAHNRMYISDAGRSIIMVLDGSDGSVINGFNFTTPVFGAMDNKIDRNFFYALTDPFNFTSPGLELAAAPHVIIYDISPVDSGNTPELVQSWNVFKAIGKIPDLMGLAIYPAARLT